jgi:hypothetical protein
MLDAKVSKRVDFKIESEVKTMNTSRVVLLSFSGALSGLADGMLGEEDLRGAIFCFGCGPEYPYTDAREIAEHYQEKRQESEKPITPAIVEMVVKHLRGAEQDGRVVWRWSDNKSLIHKALSRALEKCGLKPLNSNLPPVDDNYFLKTAIDRANNTDGQEHVRVISE